MHWKHQVRDGIYGQKNERSTPVDGIDARLRDRSRVVDMGRMRNTNRVSESSGSFGGKVSGGTFFLPRHGHGEAGESSARAQRGQMMAPMLLVFLVQPLRGGGSSSNQGSTGTPSSHSSPGPPPPQLRNDTATLVRRGEPLLSLMLLAGRYVKMIGLALPLPDDSLSSKPAGRER